MKQYNLEIFDSGMEYVSNTIIPDSIKYKYDYMDPEKFDINLLPGTKADINNYVRIWADNEVFFGIVSAVNEKENGIRRITVKDIATMFDIDILVDTELMTGSLEEYIANRIDECFIHNPDESMNIPATVTTSTTEVDSWVLDAEVEDEELTTLSEVNLFDDIILKAFTDYDVVINIDFDIETRTFAFSVGRNKADAIMLEADLPNIISKNVEIFKSKSEVNKVIVYNTDTWTDAVTYYLHPDGTWDDVDEDRITPVNYKIERAGESTEKDESTNPPTEVTVPFEDNAYKEAEKVFFKNKYENEIKLEIFNDDDLIKAYDWKIGQIVNVIVDGTVYPSIYSAREVGKTTTLIFGKIRVDIIKMLKGRS